MNFSKLHGAGNDFSLFDGIHNPVSYTHLDVYKRQARYKAGQRKRSGELRRQDRSDADVRWLRFRSAGAGAGIRQAV